MNAPDISMFGVFFALKDGKETCMKILNGSEVTVRPYQEKDVEKIVNLIRRNFLEVNVKDYGEEAGI